MHVHKGCAPALRPFHGNLSSARLLAPYLNRTATTRIVPSDAAPSVEPFVPERADGQRRGARTNRGFRKVSKSRASRDLRRYRPPLGVRRRYAPDTCGNKKDPCSCARSATRAGSVCRRWPSAFFLNACGACRRRTRKARVDSKALQDASDRDLSRTTSRFALALSFLRRHAPKGR